MPPLALVPLVPACPCAGPAPSLPLSCPAGEAVTRSWREGDNAGRNALPEWRIQLITVFPQISAAFLSAHQLNQITLQLPPDTSAPPQSEPWEPQPDSHCVGESNCSIHSKLDP